MTTYKAAIIGCGRMSRAHINAYQEAGIPLVAGADISAEAVKKFQEDTGVEGLYTDYKRMLDEVQPELVSIVTHDALHCPMVVAAAEGGTKGIICEKPMALSLEEADRMLEACRKSGSKLTISHQRYYMPQYARARELIAAGAIGKVRSAEVCAKAGCLMTDGTHTIHMLLSLLGELKISHLLGQIDGHQEYVYYGHRAENAGTAFLAFENQVYANFNWGWLSQKPTLLLNPAWNDDLHRYHYFIIYGDQGRLELNGDIWSYDRADLDRPLLRIVRGAEVEEISLTWPPEKGAITLEIEDLIGSIETDGPHPLAGENGRAVLEVIMAIYESARRRQVIKFPCHVKENPFLAMCEAGDFPP